MKKWKNSLKIFTSAAMVGLMASSSGASENQQPVAPQFVEVMPDYLVRRIASDPFGPAAEKAIGNSLAAKGIISGAKTWNSNEPIRVCFFEGSRALRVKIAETASEWENTGAQIKFDFGDRSNPRLCQGSYNQIRIGFSQAGYWSFVGQDSVTLSAQSESSMNLAGFHFALPPEDEFRRLVLHEFGHALGFQHEHQHPLDGCESEFNWTAIYNYLSGPPNNWSREVIDHNLRGRGYLQGDVATSFDPQSIMLYAFPASFYKSGADNKCVARPVGGISSGDASTARLAYGAGAKQRSTASFAQALQANRGRLTAKESSIVQTRLEFLSSDYAGQARIIGPIQPEKTDVDIFDCGNDAVSKQAALRLSERLASLPNIGRLRYRAQALSGYQTKSGINLIVDKDHPESELAMSIASSLRSAQNQPVQVIENSGETTRWLVSALSCPG